MPDSAVLEGVTTAWAFASALGVSALGVASLVGGRARPPGAFAFGCFAISWSAHIAAGHAMPYAASPGPASLLHLLYLVFLVPLPFFLLEFVASQVPVRGGRSLWGGLRVAAGVVAASSVGLLAVAPETLYGGPVRIDDGVYPGWGPAFAPLVLGPFFAALILAVVALAGVVRLAPTPRTADQASFMLAGLGLFVAFSAGNNAAFYAADFARGAVYPGAGTYTVLFLCAAVVVLGIGLRFLRSGLRSASRAERRRARLVASSLLVPLALGGGEGILALEALPRFQSVGLWRLAGVAVLAYGIARWRVADLPERAKRGSATALGATGALAGGAATYGVLSLALPGTLFPLLVGAAVPIAATAPSVRLARSVFGLPERPARLGPAIVPLGPRLDAYRAALEGSIARGTTVEDAEFLAALRRRFRISDDVDAALRHFARTTILLPSERGPAAQYDRLRILAEGGQGRAWLARRRADDALVVLKEPLAAPRAARERARALREAELARRVRHENAVRVLDVVEERGRPVLVLEFVEGGSLASALEERRRIAADQAVVWTAEVLDALSAVHAAGLVHGDVKAENVLVDADGRARLTDFGLARPAGASPDATQALGSGEGSLGSIAPEVALGGAATARSDVYAAAAMLFRLLTGEHYLAFEGLDEREAREAVLSEPPRLPHPAVPPRLADEIGRALAKNPEERHGTAAAFRQAIVSAI